jgi:hypothetical protein
MIPIFSMALANSSGSMVPELSRSKYLKERTRTVSSDWWPDAFCESFLMSSFSKLKRVKGSVSFAYLAFKDSINLDFTVFK